MLHIATQNDNKFYCNYFIKFDLKNGVIKVNKASENQIIR